MWAPQGNPLPTSPGGLRRGLCVAPGLGEDGLWHLSSPWVHMLSPSRLHLSPPRLSLVLQNLLGHLWRSCQSYGRNESSPSPDGHHLVHDTGLVHSAESFPGSRYRRSHTYYCWWGCENERKDRWVNKCKLGIRAKWRINPGNNDRSSGKNHKQEVPGKRGPNFTI